MAVGARRRAATALAVLLPLLVLAAVGARLQGGAALTGHARGITQTLRGTVPEVVVLGSSIANRGVDAPALAEALGLPNEAVVVLSVPYATSAHHLAVLRRRVFDAGYRPSRVIVADALRPMLTHELLQDPEGVRRLAEQFDEGGEDAAARVFGDGGQDALAQGRLRAKATAWREEALAAWRDGAVWAALRPRGGRRAAAHLVDRVQAKVFTGIEQGTPAGDEPVEDAGSQDGSGWGPSPVLGEAYALHEHGLLDLLAAETQAHGASLTLARMPLPPSNRAMDQVPAALEAEARAWMAALDIDYVDLRGAPVGEDDFADLRHLTPHGAQVVSTLLGDAIRALEAGHGAVPDVAVSWGPGVTVTRDPEGVTTWRLDPGQAVELTVSGDDPVPLVLRARRLGDGPPMQVTGAEIEDLGDGVIGQGLVTGTVTVRAPEVEGGGWWVHHLALGHAPFQRVVLGRAETLHGAGVRLAGGRIDDLQTVARYPNPPPALPASVPTFRGGRAVFTAPDLARLSDAPVASWALPSRCSPVRATQAGVVQGPAHQACDVLGQAGDGATCHAGARVMVSTPATNGAAWGLALDDDRHCELFAQGRRLAVRGGWWLYPGDRATFSTGDPSRYEAVVQGLRTLRLEARALGSTDAPGVIDVQVTAGGLTYLDTVWTVQAGAPDTVGLTVALDRPMPPSVADAAVTLSRRGGDRYLLLASVVLSEAPVWAPPRVDAPSLEDWLASRQGAFPTVEPRWRQAPGGGRLAKVAAAARLAPEAMADGGPTPVLVEDAAGPLTWVSAAGFGGCRRCVASRDDHLLARGTGALSVRVRGAFDAADGWWIHPGQLGEFALPEGVRSVAVQARIVARNPAADPDRVMGRIGATRLAFGPVQADGTRWAEATIDPALGVRSLALSDPTADAHLRVVDLRVTDAQGTHRLAGGPGDVSP